MLGGYKDPAVLNFAYDGPSASVASITGSPLWGVTPEQVIADRQARGWVLNFNARVRTPYGLGPLVTQFTTSSGRDVIWIPSYGGVRGERFTHPHEGQWRLFWILWKAGVRVLFVGGTHGVNDPRSPANLQDAIRPGDIVFPWSFYRNDNMAGHLPGTGIGGVLPNLARMKDPFCVSLSGWMADLAEDLEFFPKVHRPSDVRVILRSPTGGTFESEGETMVWRHMMQTISEREGSPFAMLHGDSVTPILCRHLGMDEGYYCIVANDCEGQDVTDPKFGLNTTLDSLYVKQLPRRILEFEALLLETAPIPTNCTCRELLIHRPEVYQEALSQQ